MYMSITFADGSNPWYFYSDDLDEIHAKYISWRRSKAWKNIQTLTISKGTAPWGSVDFQYLDKMFIVTEPGRDYKGLRMRGVKFNNFTKAWNSYERELKYWFSPVHYYLLPLDSFGQPNGDVTEVIRTRYDKLGNHEYLFDRYYDALMRAQA